MSKQLSIKSLKPTPGHLLVEPAIKEKKTSSGIYLPDSHDEKPQYGTVLAAGNPIFDDGTEIKSPAQKGNTVVYKKWGGNEVQVGDTEYQFLKFEDILAVVS